MSPETRSKPAWGFAEPPPHGVVDRADLIPQAVRRGFGGAPAFGLMEQLVRQTAEPVGAEGMLLAERAQLVLEDHGAVLSHPAVEARRNQLLIYRFDVRSGRLGPLHGAELRRRRVGFR